MSLLLFRSDLTERVMIPVKTFYHRSIRATISRVGSSPGTSKRAGSYPWKVSGRYDRLRGGRRGRLGRRESRVVDLYLAHRRGWSESRRSASRVLALRSRP